MPFTKRNIEHNHRKKQQKEKFKRIVGLEGVSSIFSGIKKYIQQFSKKQIISLFLFFSIAIGGYSAYAYVRDNSKLFIEKSLQFATQTLGEDLKKDKNGLTNILIMGAGGENHDGGYLTDSIIVMTLNYDLKSVSMLSIPRDLHVRYEVEGRKRKGKINRVFMESMIYWENRAKNRDERIKNSAENIKKEIEEIIGNEIQYTAYIDFQGFVKIVNQMGGIELNLEKAIYDSQYPGPNYSYTIFSLPAGEQVLNGETALKYVRSRHGNAGGDFGRSYRQKKAIIALKDKAMNSGILTSPTEIKALLGVISENFWTDVSWQETLSLLSFAQKLDVSNLTTGGLQDLTNEEKEWFLYTPPRDLFKGQSVLLPCRIYSKTPWSDVKLYHSLMAEVPELTNSKIISIYNTTKTAGLASELEIILNRFSIEPLEVGNAKRSFKTSVIEYDAIGENAERNRIIAEKLGDWLELPVEKQKKEQISADILNNLEKDKNYKNKKNYEDEDGNGEEEDEDEEKGVLQITSLSGENSENSENSEKQEKEISTIAPARIIIYIGDDYVKEHREDILWYKKCW